MLILIAGPYRSGTNDDPKKMRENLERLESVALILFRKGHIPMIGEWVALPLLKLAGSVQPGDEPYKEILPGVTRYCVCRVHQQARTKMYVLQTKMVLKFILV